MTSSQARLSALALLLLAGCEIRTSFGTIGGQSVEEDDARRACQEQERAVSEYAGLGEVTRAGAELATMRERKCPESSIRHSEGRIAEADSRSRASPRQVGQTGMTAGRVRSDLENIARAIGALDATKEREWTEIRESRLPGARTNLAALRTSPEHDDLERQMKVIETVLTSKVAAIITAAVAEADGVADQIASADAYRVRAVRSRVDGLDALVQRNAWALGDRTSELKQRLVPARARLSERTADAQAERDHVAAVEARRAAAEAEANIPPRERAVQNYKKAREAILALPNKRAVKFALQAEGLKKKQCLISEARDSANLAYQRACPLVDGGGPDLSLPGGDRNCSQWWPRLLALGARMNRDHAQVNALWPRLNAIYADVEELDDKPTEEVYSTFIDAVENCYCPDESELLRGPCRPGSKL